MKSTQAIKNKKELENFLKNFPYKKIILFIVNPKDYKKFILTVLSFLTNKQNKSGIYITFTFPYVHLKELFKSENIKTENVYIIDCISNYHYSAEGIVTIKSDVVTMEEALYLKSPTRLSELALIIYELISSVKNPQEKFVLLDSIDSMLIYNGRDNVIKFLHFLLTKLRIFGVVGFFSSSSSKEIEEMLYMFFDEITLIESIE